MLILKRDLSQAILIDEIEVFLIAASSEVAELLLLGLPGERFRPLTVRKGETRTVHDGVSVCLVQARNGQARLGIHAPCGMDVRRAELRV